MCAMAIGLLDLASSLFRSAQAPKIVDLVRVSDWEDFWA